MNHQLSNDQNFNWYVLSVISGREFLVKSNILNSIHNTSLQNQIKEISIPTNKTITLKNNKKVEKEIPSFPGYIYIHADLDFTLKHFLSSIPSAIKILSTINFPDNKKKKLIKKTKPLTSSTLSKTKPKIINPKPLKSTKTNIKTNRPKRKYTKKQIKIIPCKLKNEELANINTSLSTSNHTLKNLSRNTSIKIISGPYTNFDAIVESTDITTNTILAHVFIFNQKQIVKLTFNQVTI
jgi:transcription antitermination factor NusG